MKTTINIILICILMILCQSSFGVAGVEENDSMNIIILSEKGEGPPSEKFPAELHVKLRLNYGIIIDNAVEKYPALYYLFDNVDKSILKTDKVDVFIAALKKLPDQSQIDIIGKCTVPFCSQYGNNIDKELDKIEKIYKEKKFKLIENWGDNKLHTSFCNCSYRKMKILDK